MRAARTSIASGHQASQTATKHFQKTQVEPAAQLKHERAHATAQEEEAAELASNPIQASARPVREKNPPRSISGQSKRKVRPSERQHVITESPPATPSEGSTTPKQRNTVPQSREEERAKRARARSLPPDQGHQCTRKLAGARAASAAAGIADEGKASCSGFRREGDNVPESAGCRACALLTSTCLLGCCPSSCTAPSPSPSACRPA